MGLFDTVMVKKKKCPACGKTLGWAFQFKIHFPLLHEFEVGDPLVKKKIIKGLDTCKLCKAPISCDIIIKNGVITKIRNLRIDSTRLHKE